MPVKIFVEGKLITTKKGKEVHSSDARFLRDCIKVWFNQELNLLENFHCIGGASEFKDMATDFSRAEEYQAILIIDANGKPDERKKEIKEFQQAKNLNFPFFLFPNDKNPGELEVLLESIVTKKELLKCFTDYEKCIGRTLDKKEKIYSYIRAATNNVDIARDVNRNFSDGNFDLNHPSLKPLKDFLTQFT